MAEKPYLRGQGKKTELMVDGRPFFIRAGEIHNSSASSPAYMDEKVWPAYEKMQVNTVLAPVYWECMEPEEGRFDDTLTDSLIRRAREHHLRLILLWFGLWKNSASTYVPEWVKKDRERFWYVRGAHGPVEYFNMPSRVISPLCREAVEADARAFRHLMRHLRETDPDHTVIMVQVENEIGILGSDRDYSVCAEEAFRGPIPEKAAEALGVSGTWADAGEYAAEGFMAWHYAQAVEHIASAGREELDLPMYVNAWLEQDPWVPGTYPSGGPQFKNVRLWRAACPSIDVYAPDIYVQDVKSVCREYADGINPLFIPETRVNPAFYLYAVGKYNAVCFAPFALEDSMTEYEKLDRMTQEMLKITALPGLDPHKAGQVLQKAYAQTAEMEDMIREAHEKGRIEGFLCGGEEEETVELAGVRVHVRYEKQDGELVRGGGLVLAAEDHEFWVLALNCAVTFEDEHGSLHGVDMLLKEEGWFSGKQWIRGRILNGDERYRNVFGNELVPIRFRLLSCGG